MTKYLTERYLTPAEKEYIFDTSTWSQVDSGLLPYLSRLNSLDGVCTIQSCIGHCHKLAYGSGDHVESGNLWLRLSEAMSEQFRQRVGLLTLSPLVRQVRTLYSFDEGSYPHEVVDISFHGAEDDSLDEALSYIACFFEGISEGG